MGFSFIFMKLECNIISSVFYIPGTYHPSISHISPRWRSSVSSGETSPGNLFTNINEKKCHVVGLQAFMNYDNSKKLIVPLKNERFVT